MLSKLLNTLEDERKARKEVARSGFKRPEMPTRVSLYYYGIVRASDQPRRGERPGSEKDYSSAKVRWRAARIDFLTYPVPCGSARDGKLAK